MQWELRASSSWVASSSIRSAASSPPPCAVPPATSPAESRTPRVSGRRVACSSAPKPLACRSRGPVPQDTGLRDTGLRGEPLLTHHLPTPRSRRFATESSSGTPSRFVYRSPLGLAFRSAEALRARCTRAVFPVALAPSEFRTESRSGLAMPLPGDGVGSKPRAQERGSCEN